MSWGRAIRGLVGIAAALAAALLCPSARADVPVTLLKSFAGNVNFTGTLATMRTGQNYCSTHNAKTVLNNTLTGIPAGSQVLAAYLYWAGSGSTADYQVTFDGKAISAQRKYTSRYSANGYNYDYFAGVADVTAQVAAKGNATYSFTGLTINNKDPYCSVQGVLGGFSLLVIYKNATTEPFRVLNLFEGLQDMRYSSITLNVGNFKVPNPIGTATGRVGHITWEGDLALNQQGEDLAFNGTILTDAMNPAGNQFNSQSNINGDKASYGIDFDAYTISPPLIQPGQTSATTKYSSGQDMVLLNAEIVAVPNVPVADLSITMTRSGEPAAGASVSYSLGVVNNGPNQETGPVTVTDTLPSGMSFASVGGGPDWTCTTSGQTVTCTYKKAVPSGTVLPAITVTATVLASGSGSYTNTAAVSGVVFDNVSVNNSASDTSTSGPVFALTDRPCTAGVPISTNPADTNCHRVNPIISGAKQNAYITNVDSKGVPAALFSSKTTVSLQFGLTCVNPTTAGVASGAKVKATFYVSSQPVTLPACSAPGGTVAYSTAVSLVFNANSPTALSPDLTATQLSYPDVGVLQLNVLSGTTLYTTRLVSQPVRLSFLDVKSGQLSSPGNIAGQPGFIPAGETFTVRVRAENDTFPNNPYESVTSPPNFGNESPPSAVAMQQVSAPQVEGTMGTPVAGIATGQLTYPEAGYVQLTPVMATTGLDYMGSGVPVPGVARVVGRFYPAYFTTTVSSKFDCQPSMGCPTGKLSSGEDLGVSGAAYSGQAFNVQVTPYNKAGDAMTKYVGTITLSAVDKPGPAGVQVGATVGVLTVPAAPSLLPDGSGVYSADPVFTLPNKFDPASPHAMGWSAPTSIYLRAQAQETVVTSTGATVGTTISSMGATGKVAEEDGVQVVVGRMQVSNAFGSEVLKLKVPVTAQYWSKTSWDNNIGDDVSGVGPASFTSCTGRLSTGSGVNNCNLNLLKVSSAPSSVTDGVGTVLLEAPGRGNTGSGMMSVFKSGQPWIPVLPGKVVFGINKSPVIYIREVY